MADPIITTGNENSKTNFYGNAGLQAGYRTSIDGNDQIIVFGPRVEGGFQRGGWHGNVGLGVGTAVTADAEIGHEFSLHETLGLDLSAYASHATSLCGKSESIIAHIYHNEETNEVKAFEDPKSWRPGITEAGLKAMLNIKPNDKVKIGVGLSGGYVQENAPTHIYTSNYKGDSLTSSGIEGYRGITVSPELAVDIKAGKNVTFGANANIYGGNATVAWNF